LPGETIKCLHKRGTFADQREGTRQLSEIPVERFGLPGKAVKPFMVKIGGCETRLPIRRETPRAIVETFAGNIDIVRVENAVNKSGRHITGRKPGRFHSRIMK